MTTAETNLEALPLSEISARCADETSKRREGGSCYELWRRAIVGRSNDAWQLVYGQYERLVRSWVVRHPFYPSLPPSDSDTDLLANGVFARFWQSLTADRFHDFASTAALLGFLRRCANSIVLETGRQVGRRQRREAELGDDVELAAPSPEEEADEAARMQLWSVAQQVAMEERERVLLELCYRSDLKPAVIAARRPDLFPSTQDVYKCKRNLLDRLRRNPEVLALAGELD